MNNSFKIRILLLVLTFCFIGTALTIRVTSRKEEVLRVEARQIESNLHEKETYIKSLLQDTAFFNALKNIHSQEDFAQRVVEEIGEHQKLFIYTYSNSELTFWGANKIVPQSDAGLPEGSSLIVADNGWYEAIRKSKGGFSVVCLIPIKSKYALKNDYLNDDFSTDLIRSQNLTIANYDDNPVYNIRGSDGKYLFSVRLKHHTYNTLNSKLELAMWLAAMLAATILMNSLCVWLVSKDRVKLSVVFFLSYFVVIRYVDLKTGWMSNHFFNDIFDPKFFASSFIFPSLGAFLLNVIATAWFMCYVYNYRYLLFTKRPFSSRLLHILFFLLSALAIFIVTSQISDVFKGLIGNSNIQFDVSNILQLNLFSWLGISALCLVILNLYLFLEILFAIGSSFNIDKRQWITLFLLILLLYTLILSFLHQLSLSFFLFSAIILLRSYAFYETQRFNLLIFISTLLLFAGIASMKQNQFIENKELEFQKRTLQRLESADDPDAVFIFYSIENNVVKDPYLVNYFSNPGRYNIQVLNNYLKQSYFSGYLSRYDLNIYELKSSAAENDSISTNKLSYYRQKVESGAIKVSEYFYRPNNSFGQLLYFGLIPVMADGREIGTTLIELTSKAFLRYASYPEVLSNGRSNKKDDLEQYSFSLYRNGKLVHQFGSRLFPITDAAYPKDIQKYIQIDKKDGGVDLIYRPSPYLLMVLSKDGPGLWVQLASLSFLFLVLLFFAILVYAFQWLLVTFKNYNFSFRTFKRSYWITQNKILYRTRIQAFVVLAVVVTLIIAGVITFFSISSQYRYQQQINTIKRINQLSSGFESTILKKSVANTLQIESSLLNSLSTSNATDINLYDAFGHLRYTTQNKIYDLGLTSRYMDANAWLHMDTYHRAEFLHMEKIGELTFPVAYAPIKNNLEETIGYLSLLDFSSERDFADRIGMLLSTLINIYALVIVALGLFAVFIANRITAPLTLVQRSLAKTSIGKINEPIFWKRNDEIGSLIKEYNNMIAALEISANKIAQSERESAWREMAKQVAHEIKNPLTPLKLGVQLLDRSWNEQDPNFEQKFKRFTKSFIEQIDSLSTIASEFSNFAKMPDTQLEAVDLIDILEKVIPIYNNTAAVEISLSFFEEERIIVQGDRDQLRRSFSNLIKNAIEAKAGRGKCMINISVKRRDSFITLAFRDNGNGIPEHVRDKIFQPNFTTKSSGTGLGLAFVKQTVESMKGKITYITHLGYGTTFYIEIPLSK